jgi:hypothetical protein
MTPNGANSTKNAEKSPKRGENSMENSILAEIVHLMAVARCVFFYKKNVDFQKKKKICFIFFTLFICIFFFFFFFFPPKMTIFTNKCPKKNLKPPKKTGFRPPKPLSKSANSGICEPPFSAANPFSIFRMKLPRQSAKSASKCLFSY